MIWYLKCRVLRKEMLMTENIKVNKLQFIRMSLNKEKVNLKNLIKDLRVEDLKRKRQVVLVS